MDNATFKKNVFNPYIDKRSFSNYIMLCNLKEAFNEKYAKDTLIFIYESYIVYG